MHNLMFICFLLNLQIMYYKMRLIFAIVNTIFYGFNFDVFVKSQKLAKLSFP